MEEPALKPRLLNQLNSLGLRKRGGFNQDRCLTLEAGLVQEGREEVQVSGGWSRSGEGSHQRTLMVTMKGAGRQSAGYLQVGEGMRISTLGEAT